MRTWATRKKTCWVFGRRTAPPGSSLLRPKYFWWCSSSFQRGNYRQHCHKSHKSPTRGRRLLSAHLSWGSSASRLGRVFPPFWFGFPDRPQFPLLTRSLLPLPFSADTSRWRPWTRTLPVRCFKIRRPLRGSRELNCVVLSNLQHITLLNRNANVTKLNAVTIEQKTN